MDEKIVAVLNEMSEYLSISQMKKLQEVILKTFSENEPIFRILNIYNCLLKRNELKAVRKEQFNTIRARRKIYCQRLKSV